MDRASVSGADVARSAKRRPEPSEGWSQADEAGALQAAEEQNLPTRNALDIRPYFRQPPNP
ncbi:MAG: hypothetical protein ACPGN3_17260 [Opitutales bacterium]